MSMLLITGATGNIGTALVRELASTSIPTRVLVRDQRRAAHIPESIERAVGDLEDADSLGGAFNGVDALFLLTPGIGVTMARNALSAASRAGVGHVVLLSSTNVVGDPVPAMGRWHHEREVLVRESMIPWTILRPNGFMTNALEWVPTLAASGYVLDATGPGRHAVIDPVDIAAVAAVTLTTPGHQGVTYTLTGPESLTTAEQVRILSQTLGAAIELREVKTADEAVRSRFPNGAPEPLAAAIVEAWQLMRADTIGRRTDTVERLLERAPGTFRHWCESNADVISAAGVSGGAR
jgi:uncharacterized protein YbjT (DUF2867 family)